MTMTTSQLRAQRAEQQTQVEQFALGTASQISALPVPLSLSLYRGDDFYLDLTVTDTHNNPIDLTGATPAAQIRLQPTDATPLATFTATVDATATNVIHLKLPHSVTATLPSTAQFDCQITQANGDIVTLVAGTITMAGEITKP